MRWLLPPAEMIVCEALESDSNGFERTSCQAYAMDDALFLSQLKIDSHLRDILDQVDMDKKINWKKAKKDPSCFSALLTIERALLIRSGFAIEQKARLLTRLHLLSEEEEKQQVMELANQEVKQTLQFLSLFQKPFAPFLDERITLLEDVEKLDNASMDHHEDGDTVGTEEDLGIEG